jgi:HipA N-terminal domain
MERALLVYVDLGGVAHLAGRLWARVRKGRESATFEYDSSWLAHAERFALEPALSLFSGPQYTSGGRALSGALGDSAPDRWGRMLMQRAERRAAKKEGRAPHTLLEADSLLREDDPTASLDRAMDVAEYFEVRAPQARRIAGEVGRAVSRWRRQAARLGIDSVEIDRMASAFEHDDLRKSLKMRPKAS